MQANMILSIVSLKLFILIYTSITMGDVYLLFEVKSILFISLVALYLLTLTTRRTTNYSNS